MKNLLKKMLSSIGKLLWNNRVKSLLWRSAMMGAAVGIDYLIENLSDLDIPSEYAIATVFIGLVLGEISKAIHNNISAKVAAKRAAASKKK